jgi:hypothetical protein
LAKLRKASTPKTKARPKPKAAPTKAARKTKPAPAKAAHAPVEKVKAAPKPAPPAKTLAGKPGQRPAAAAPPAKPGAPAQAAAPLRPPSKKSSRRSPLLQRRGPDGQLLQPGDLLLPGGAQSPEEVQYLFRGVIATQRPVGDLAITEVLAKRPPGDPIANRGELDKHYSSLTSRFSGGAIEPTLPNRPQPKRTFQGVIERAKQRRREIGAFLRGLDLGKTESSQMDSHGEASLQSLMEWSARLEKLMDTDEPAQADYTVFHRAMDQLDHTTEALIVDVEATLRRLGARAR